MLALGRVSRQPDVGDSVARMEVAAHIDVIAAEGAQMSSAIRAAGFDAAVPTCPGWLVRDLARHQGWVHRWAAGIVRDGRDDARFDPDDVDPAPDADIELMDWFDRGCAELVAVLTAAAPDVACWSMTHEPEPLRFWARLQAHETSIHRFDAEAAAGRASACDPESAADGIDELLTYFATRPRSPLRVAEPTSLLVYARDLDRGWLVALGPEVPTTHAFQGRASAPRDPGTGIEGSAADLFLLLSNRQGPDRVEVTGDRSLLDLWRSTMTI